MTGHEYTIEIPGAVGSFEDRTPPITPAQIRPYLVAMLLHHGYVRPCDLVAAITPLCHTDDLKVGGWDSLSSAYCEGTRLEKLVGDAILDFADRELITYDPALQGWILTMTNLSKVFSWVATLDAKFPAHLSTQIVNRYMSQPACRHQDHD